MKKDPCGSGRQGASGHSERQTCISCTFSGAGDPPRGPSLPPSKRGRRDGRHRFIEFKSRAINLALRRRFSWKGGNNRTGHFIIPNCSCGTKYHHVCHLYVASITMSSSCGPALEQKFRNRRGVRSSPSLFRSSSEFPGDTRSCANLRPVEV